MINSFLVSLHNNATPPVNVSSTTGSVLWPSNVNVRSYNGPSALAQTILFGGVPTSSFDHFLGAIQLLWVVEESVCADTITADDPLISYNREQLIGQFVGNSSANRQSLSRILQQFDSIPAREFLSGRLLHLYRSSLAKIDRLAAVITYFGVRNPETM